MINQTHRLTSTAASSARSSACACALAAILSTASLTSVAAPLVTSVSGSAAEGATITISGQNFGGGPTVVLYDDFNNGTVGATIPLTSPTIGDWSSAVRPFVYDSIARSGKTAARIYNNGDESIVRKNFSDGVTEVMLSFWVRIPDGTSFPGDTSGPGTFSSNSSWKMAWLIDTSYDGSSSDLCIPTHIGNGSFYLAGNDFNLVTLPKSSGWWSWKGWTRMTVWLRANPSAPASDGQYMWQAVSAEHGISSLGGSRAVFDADGPSTKEFKFINVPGWVRGGGRPVYDDVYLTAGPNAQARIEIGDAPTYAASKHLALVPPSSWSSTSITAKLPSGALPPNGAPAYVYIVDKDGVANATGIPLECKVCPKPPTDLTVQ